MSSSRNTVFEDLSSDLHISIFEYLDANELTQSFFNLNQYFNQLLVDHHLLLHCMLINDETDFNTLLLTISLQQLKLLRCYDYHLIQMNNPVELSCLRSLTIYKYATNISDERVIDFILHIPQLKYCQIKCSQSSGRIQAVSPNRDTIPEKVTSNLEYLDIDSKSGILFSYFYYNVLPYLPLLRSLKVYIYCRDGNHKVNYKPINTLMNLSKLIIKIHSAKFNHLNVLACCTNNLEHLRLDGDVHSTDYSFFDAKNWLKLLLEWFHLKFLRIYVQMRLTPNVSHQQLDGIQQVFKSVAFLVDRHFYTTYFLSSTNIRRIYFNANYRENQR